MVRGFLLHFNDVYYIPIVLDSSHNLRTSHVIKLLRCLAVMGNMLF